MKKQILYFVVAVALIGATWNQAKAQSCPIIPFAVVELFTSQGCSYCPAADESLDSVIAAERLSGRNVICIQEHVTYWNNQWVDPFGDAQFSPRQTVYCQNVIGGPVQKGSPECFINGKHIAAPSPRTTTINPIINSQLGSANAATAAVCLSLLTPVSTPTLTVSYSLSGNYAAANLIVCLVEDSLVSKPTAGENQGATLHESGVSRKFIVTPITSATGTINIAPPANCIRKNSQIVAYIQDTITTSSTSKKMFIRGATKGIDLNSVTTGVQNADISVNVNVYPNPAASFVTVQGSTNADHVSYTLCNMMGAEIKSGNIYSNGTSFYSNIQLNDISSGMYFLKITDGKGLFTQILNKQ